MFDSARGARVLGEDGEVRWERTGEIYEAPKKTAGPGGILMHWPKLAKPK